MNIVRDIGGMRMKEISKTGVDLWVMLWEDRSSNIGETNVKTSTPQHHSS